MLIDNGADINTQDQYGYTLLHKAVKVNDAEKTTMLLQYNPDVNIPNSYGEITLVTALDNKNNTILKMLIDNGAELNAQDQYGYTLLHNAVKDNDAEKMAMLLQYKPDVNIPNSYDETPLVTALDKKNNTIIKMLIENGADINAQDQVGYTLLHKAVEDNDAEKMAMLLQYKPDVNIPNRYGQTPLVTALGKKNNTILKILIENGADINAQDQYGYTLLNNAIRDNDAEKIAMLLQCKNINVNIADRITGWTPLHLAIDKQQIAVVRQLLENKECNINTQSSRGSTPLHFAIEKNDAEICDLLLLHKADMTIENNDHLSAFDFAITYGHLPLAIKINNPDLAKERMAKRDLYLLFGEKLADCIPSDLQKKFDGGYRKSKHAVNILNDTLRAYVGTIDDKHLQTTGNYIIDLLEQAVRNKTLSSTEIAKTFAANPIQIIFTGWLGHFIPAILHDDGTKITLCLIDSGPLWNYLFKNDKGKAISACTIEIPRENLDVTIALLQEAYALPEKEAERIFLQDIPRLAREGYTVEDYKQDKSSAVANYKHGTCFISNLKRAIRYLMIQHSVQSQLSTDDKIKNYKHFSLFLRAHGLEKAKHLLSNDSAIITKAETELVTKAKKR